MHISSYKLQLLHKKLFKINYYNNISCFIIQQEK